MEDKNFKLIMEVMDSLTKEELIEISKQVKSMNLGGPTIKEYMALFNAHNPIHVKMRSVEILKINITDHAYERAKERINWNKSTLDKMASKSFNNGIKHSDTKGALNKYITKLWFEHKTANNIRIHGEVVYLFRNNLLITLYQLPNEFKKIANKLSN